MLESLWSMIGDHLQAHRRRILDEIRHYPPPIPACDAQFNYLLEQRDGIERELERLRETAAGSASHGDSVELLDEFLRSCKYVDDRAKQRVFDLIESKR